MTPFDSDPFDAFGRGGEAFAHLLRDTQKCQGCGAVDRDLLAWPPDAAPSTAEYLCGACRFARARALDEPGQS